jgi:cysteine desulfurase
MKKIYLDHNASTPMAQEVVQAMQPFLHEHFGNPSSKHWASLPAREAFEKARAQVAGLLGCDPQEIVITSGGSEANNHAIKGAFFANPDKKHIITSSIEHPAVVKPCEFLTSLGAELTVLPVDKYGLVEPQEVEKAIRPDTLLISIMHANNEVGTIEPIAEFAKLAKQHGVLFHCDAAQSVGKIPTRVSDLGVDMLSVAGHKLYAPKGVGALYIKKGTKLETLIHGAGHEAGRRAGTENVLLAVGLGAACQLAQENMQTEKIQALCDRLWQELHSRYGQRVQLNGHPKKRLPNTLNVSFIGQIGSELLAKLEGVAASTGAACHEDQVILSPVLAAMGTDPEIGKGAIRFSLGRGTTDEDISALLSLIEATGF